MTSAACATPCRSSRRPSRWVQIQAPVIQANVSIVVAVICPHRYIWIAAKTSAGSTGRVENLREAAAVPAVRQSAARSKRRSGRCRTWSGSLTIAESAPWGPAGKSGHAGEAAASNAQADSSAMPVVISTTICSVARGAHLWYPKNWIGFIVNLGAEPEIDS